MGHVNGHHICSIAENHSDLRSETVALTCRRAINTVTVAMQITTLTERCKHLVFTAINAVTFIAMKGQKNLCAISQSNLVEM